jgi:glycosyltransferase involved in cell wall biosynthesis
MKSFSIAIPVYKVFYLAECIQSILQQTYQNFELIIVNDKSPYNVDEVINKFTDKRIKYFVNETNIGAENLVLNWNGCLEKASGDYFVMMGDDDAMEPDFLEQFSLLIDKYPLLDVFHCRSKIIDENSQPYMLTPSCPEFESVYDNIWHRIKGYRVQFISDFVYRTAALKANNGYHYFPLAWGSDDVTAYIMCGDKGIAHINRPIFRYRNNRHTISNTGNHQIKMNAILMHQKWLEDFLKKEPVTNDDRIIHQALTGAVIDFIKKRKTLNISGSLNANFFKNLKLNYTLRKKHGLGVKDIVLASIYHFKEKLVKK